MPTIGDRAFPNAAARKHLQYFKFVNLETTQSVVLSLSYPVPLYIYHSMYLVSLCVLHISCKYIVDIYYLCSIPVDSFIHLLYIFINLVFVHFALFIYSAIKAVRVINKLICPATVPAIL